MTQPSVPGAKSVTGFGVFSDENPSRLATGFSTTPWGTSSRDDLLHAALDKLPGEEREDQHHGDKQAYQGSLHEIRAVLKLRLAFGFGIKGIAK
jgi:hypothetical protein